MFFFVFLRWLAVRLEFIGNFVIFFTALFGVIGRDRIESGLVGLSLTVALEVCSFLINGFRWGAMKFSLH